MKAMRLVLMIGIAALAVIGFSPVLAFHTGGVGECIGCHSMHEPLADDDLLKWNDSSSTCLDCHENAGDTGPSSYHISTAPADMPAGVPPKQRTPGGDFGWVKKTYVYTLRGSSVTDSGDTHGHNIVALDNLYTADPVNLTAPGGTMSSANLSCVNCHDPHSNVRRIADGTLLTPDTGVAGSYPPIFSSGSYNNSPIPPAGLAVGIYRILGGATYPAYDGGPNFPGVPAAVAPSTYNRSETTFDTRVAYGHSATSGGYTSWGNWCATCHPDMHSNNGYVHPVDQTLGSTLGNYNRYLKTGDLTGTVANSFTSLVPFHEGTRDFATLASHALNNGTAAATAGPVGADRVSCLSCHRAHASAWEFALRWNPENEFLTMADSAGVAAYPGVGAVGTTPDGRSLATQTQVSRGYSVTEMAAAYYDRPATKFAPYQRQLCNKCHIQD